MVRKKFIRRIGVSALGSLLAVLLVSCGESDGGADDGEAAVRYRVEMEKGGASCLSRIEYRTGDGNLRTVSSFDQSDWKKTVYAKDGASLYLRAEIDCGEVTVSIYLNGSLAERKTRTDRATVEGVLRIDSEGKATFDDAR